MFVKKNHLKLHKLAFGNEKTDKWRFLFVCVCVFGCVFLGVCICLHVCVCVCMCEYIHMHVCTYVCIFACESAYMSIYIYVSTCTFSYVRACERLHKLQVNTHTPIHTPSPTQLENHNACAYENNTGHIVRISVANPVTIFQIYRILELYIASIQGFLSGKPSPFVAHLENWCENWQRLK